MLEGFKVGQIRFGQPGLDEEYLVRLDLVSMVKVNINRRGLSSLFALDGVAAT